MAVRLFTLFVSCMFVAFSANAGQSSVFNSADAIVIAQADKDKKTQSGSSSTESSKKTTNKKKKTGGAAEEEEPECD